MCTTLYYIILTRWPLTNSQSIHFPQFATTRLSKICFSRLTLISPYCYCDSYYYYYYYCYLLWFFVMFVVTCCVRLYDLFFLYFVIFNRLSKRFKSISKFDMWDLALHELEYFICEIWVNLFISCVASRRAEACRHFWLIRKVAEGASLFKVLLLFPSSTIFRDMQMHLRCN